MENALNKEEGVWAKVSLKDSAAEVRMKKPLSREELERVIQQAGYRLTSFVLTKAEGE